MNDEKQEIEIVRVSVGIHCDTINELIYWIQWAHNRNRPFHALPEMDDEIGFYFSTILADNEDFDMVKNTIIKKRE